MTTRLIAKFTGPESEKAGVFCTIEFPSTHDNVMDAVRELDKLDKDIVAEDMRCTEVTTVYNGAPSPAKKMDKDYKFMTSVVYDLDEFTAEQQLALHIMLGEEDMPFMKAFYIAKYRDYEMVLCNGEGSHEYQIGRAMMEEWNIPEKYQAHVRYDRIGYEKLMNEEYSSSGNVYVFHR